MALPSQHERTGELGRAYVYRRQQGKKVRPPMPLIVVGVGIAVIAAGWGIISLLPRSDADPNAGSQPLLRVDQSPPNQAAGLITPPTSQPNSQPNASTGAKTAPGPASTPGDPLVLRQQTWPKQESPKPDASKANAAQPAGRTTPASTTASENPPVSDSRPKLDDPSSLVVSDPGRKDAPASSAPPSTQPPSSTPTAAIAPSGSTSDVVALIAQGESLLSSDPVQARAVLSRAYHKAAAPDQDRIRQKLTKVNDDLVFGPRIVAGDPLVEQYSVKSGDSLVRIGRARGLAVDWRFIQRINGVDPSKLRVGQKLKLVRGPFHAVVHKGDYRLDLFQGPPDDPANWIFIRSFPVGLGEGNSTPPGTFVIRRDSKLINPHWVNPRTGEKFDADDPKNPIGERWLGFEGVGESSALTGYGLHGTIEPDSIGKQKSMGCVRMGDSDIELAYAMLEEQISVVKIVP